MSASIKVSYQEFGEMTKQFLDSLSKECFSDEQIQNGWKCLSLAYLGGTEWKEYEKLLAASKLEYAANKYIEWEVQEHLK